MIMRQWFLDMISPPSVTEVITELVLDNFKIVVLILVVLLVLAVTVVNICILKKNRKSPKSEDIFNSEDKTWL